MDVDDSSQNEDAVVPAKSAIKKAKPQPEPKVQLSRLDFSSFLGKMETERAKSREADAALALLSMHEETAEERERRERLKQLAELAALDHPYSRRPGTVGRPPRRPQEEAPETDVTDSASEGEPDMIPCLPPSLTGDHQYCQLYYPIDYAEHFRRQRDRVLGPFRPDDYYAKTPDDVHVTDFAQEVEVPTLQYIKKYVNRGRRRKEEKENKGSRELASLLPTVEKPKPKFRQRSLQEQLTLVYEFIDRGMDEEDVNFLKVSQLSGMLQGACYSTSNPFTARCS